MATIIIKLGDEELEHLSRGGAEYGPRLSRLLDEEMTNFDEWMQRELGGRLIPLERTMLKTYLYHKLVGRVSALDQKKIDPIETIADSID